MVAHLGFGDSACLREARWEIIFGRASICGGHRGSTIIMKLPVSIEQRCNIFYVNFAMFEGLYISV